MRKQFADTLHELMSKDENIVLIVADLGYFIFDRIRADFPDRFYNVGAAELCAMNIAIGLALSGKIPIVYSITPFLILRPFESIRTYINHEKIPVKLIGSGRDNDYEHDGISHFAHDIPAIMELFPNIKSYYPENKEFIKTYLKDIIYSDEPVFLSLKRCLY